jgi:hypothetical protein
LDGADPPRRRIIFISSRIILTIDLQPLRSSGPQPSRCRVRSATHGKHPARKSGSSKYIEKLRSAGSISPILTLITEKDFEQCSDVKPVLGAPSSEHIWLPPAIN